MHKIVYIDGFVLLNNQLFFVKDVKTLKNLMIESQCVIKQIESYSYHFITDGVIVQTYKKSSSLLGVDGFATGYFKKIHHKGVYKKYECDDQSMIMLMMNDFDKFSKYDDDHSHAASLAFYKKHKDNSYQFYLNTEFKFRLYAYNLLQNYFKKPA